MNVIKNLAEEYPLLYLNPNIDSQNNYKRVVLRGEEPKEKDLSHYVGDAFDKMEMVEIPTGTVRVITLGCRRDFELVLRGLMAAKSGPGKMIPESQGAAMLTVFNWPRIHAHLSQFPKEERAAELKHFTSVKTNYLDMLVVLSRGPYSHVDAAAVGCTEEEWLALSDTIRRWHELTHVICRRLYPGDISPIRDELVADAVGLCAAYGHFDPDLEQLFLGIRDGRYVGGRLGNYTDRPKEVTEKVCSALERIKESIDAQPGEEPFHRIPDLMEAADIDKK